MSGCQAFETDNIMEFFYFCSPESYHFFQWIRLSSRVDVNQLVKTAFDKVEQNDWYQMGMDVSQAARQELGELLEEQYQDFQAEWAAAHFLPAPEELELAEMGEAGDTLDGLFLPLINKSVHSARMDFETVAEAILRSLGKWAPDKERPEAK